MSYEKKYWSYGEYVLPSGLDYNGYVRVKDGVVYMEGSDVQLTRGGNYLANFNTSENFFDRILGDGLELPYNKHQVSLAPNDFIQSANIKAIIKRLNANNDYIFKCSTISSTVFPSTPADRIDVMLPKGSKLERGKLSKVVETLFSGTTENYQENATFFSTEGKSGKVDLCQLQNATMSVLSVDESKDGVRVASLLAALVFKTKVVLAKLLYDVTANELKTELDFSDNSSNTLILDTLDPHNKNSLRFLNIVDVKFHDNEMFLLDGDLAMLAKYDVSCFLGESGSWELSQVNLISSMQGRSNKIQYFSRPTALAVSDDAVYVADASSRSIKKYTLYLDFVRAFRNGEFSLYDVKDMAFCPYSLTLPDGNFVAEKSLWILSQSTNSVYISIVSDDKKVYSRLVERLNLASDGRKTDLWKEDAVSIDFSPSNSNYFYLTTNKRILKLHVSKPTKPFASMDLYGHYHRAIQNIWRIADFRWDKVFEDVDLTWEYTNEDAKTDMGFNSCFCVCGDNSFNGDLILNASFIYTSVAIKRFAPKAEDFNTLPSYQKVQCLRYPCILVFNERHEYETLLATTDFSCYQGEDVQELNPDEYINPITFNKFLYKIAFNLDRMKNLMKGRFVGYYSANGMVLCDGLDNSYSLFKNLNIIGQENLFVHSNETNNILINRCFECIWNLQSDILAGLECSYTTTPRNSTVKYIYID